MFRANPMAKLFALRVVTKNEYKREKSTETIMAPNIPIKALEYIYENTTAANAPDNIKPSMATFIIPA
jgi:hypothetical protein